MDSPVPRATLWRLLGLLLYLVGLTLSLFIVVDIFVSGGLAADGEVPAQVVAVLALSIVLIVLGRAITWKFGGRGAVSGQPPQNRDQSPLEQMGYVTPEPPDDPPPEPPDEESVVCPECGTKNERGFTYCHNCSAELPD